MAWAKPSMVTLDSDSGIYGGATARIGGSSSYPYVYVGGESTDWKYWLKGTLSGGSCIISFDADRSVTSGYREFQIILSDTKITNGTTLGGNAGNYIYYFRCPGVVCRIHNGGPQSPRYDSYNDSNLASQLRKTGWTLEGLTTSSTSTNATYSASWSGSLNGKTLYAIHSYEGGSESETCYYYRGSSTRYSVRLTHTIAPQIMYGEGNIKVTGSGGTSLGSMTTTCASNSSYYLVGWATSSSSTSVRYTDAEDAFNAGYSTIYGVYRKLGGSSNSTCYYYRGDSTRRSVTKTTTTDTAYYYGTGRHSGGGTSTSYGSMTTTCASDSSYSLVGWATSSNTTSTSYSSATSAFNAGYGTIYGVYKKNGSSSNSNVYYYRGDGNRNTVTKTTTTADAYYYGTGSHSGGSSSNSYGSVTTACAVSGWTYLGFSSSSTTTNATSSATSLWNSGYTTIYGTYSKTESMTYYPQNGSSSSSVSTTNYRYGTGSVTNNRPTEPSLTYADHTFQGWGTSSTDDTPEPWDALWDAGTRTVYAIWLEDYIYNVYFGLSGSWERCKVYFGQNGQWKESLTHVGVSGGWKQ